MDLGSGLEYKLNYNKCDTERVNFEVKTLNENYNMNENSFRVFNEKLTDAVRTNSPKSKIKYYVHKFPFIHCEIN